VSPRIIDHLLHCEVTTELWGALLQLFGVTWVMPRRVSDLLGSWRGRFENCNALKIWRLAPLCLLFFFFYSWVAAIENTHSR
jgi:hypothetical protein